MEDHLLTPVATGRLIWGRVASPIGDLLVLGRDGVLMGVFGAGHERRTQPRSDCVEDADAFDRVRQQLREYFDGTRTSFDLRMELAGSPFQRRVWHELLEIPFGQTVSYGELAKRIDHPSAARAVGSANSRNPIAVIVPCHRVNGADGALTGYGWGIHRKAWLLEHERAVMDAAASLPSKRTVQR